MVKLPGVLTRSVIVDVLVVLLEGLTVLLVSLFGVPRERGFTCSDVTIRLPYREQTISTLVLGISFVIGSIVLMALVELLLVHGACSPSTVQTRKRALPVWMVQLYRSSMTFLCGAGLSQMVTDIAKFHVGALRPHFMAVCSPRVSCSPKDINYDPYQYHEHANCQNNQQHLIDEARVSFPSGHANISFYCATFLVVYFQARLSRSEDRPGRQPRSLSCFLLRPLLQGMVFLAAWFTTVSRVMDNMHHYRDVFVGGLTGALAALLIIRSIGPFREVRVLEPYHEETPLREVRPSGAANSNHVHPALSNVEVTIHDGRAGS